MSHFRWVFIFGLLVLLIFGGVKNYKRSPKIAGGLIIPENAVVEISGKRLDEAETAQLRALFAGLWTHEKRMNAKPDFKIEAHFEGEKHTHFYSVWVDKGFVLDGYFSGNSRSEGMTLTQPNFRLDRKTAKFLSQFFHE